MLFLASGNGLGFAGLETLAAIPGNSAVDDRTAIEAFPGIEYQKEI